MLLFAEDPGAVNYITPIITILKNKKIKFSLFAAGYACKILKQQNIKYKKINSQTDANKIIDVIKPELVITGTSENKNSFAFKLIKTARQRNITTIAVVDAAMNARYRFSGVSKSALKYAPDYLIVPNVLAKKEFVKIGFNKNNIFICGYPWALKLKTIKSQFKKQKNKNKRKTVLFLSEISSGLDPDLNNKKQFLFRGYTNSSSRTDVVLEELLLALNNIIPRPTLIVRLHPKDKVKHYKKYTKFINTFDQSSSAYPPIMSSTLVVGMTTTLLAEAYYLGANTLCILPRKNEKYWLSEVYEGLIPCVKNRAALNKKLAMLLNKNTRNHKTVITNYEMSVKKVLKKVCA